MNNISHKKKNKKKNVRHTHLGSSASGIFGSGDHFLLVTFLLSSVVDKILLNIGSSDKGIPALTVQITVAHSATVNISSHEWLDIIICAKKKILKNS